MNFAVLAASTVNDIEARVNSFSLRSVLLAALVLTVLLVVTSRFKKRLPKVKLPLFCAIVATVLAPTFILFGSTIYLNTTSDSGGPVHWHTDFEFWVCGQEVELRNPSAFLSNKIGTASFHEHNDKRMHLEGVVIDKEHDASMAKFMQVVGGQIDDHSITIPVEDSLLSDKNDGDVATGTRADVEALVQKDSDNKKVIKAQNGQNCGEQPSLLQAFVYSFDKDSNTYNQHKLSDPSQYVMRDESNVPPGDCLIVEFAPLKNKTDRLCEQYGVRDRDRCQSFGVENPSAKVCSIHEVETTGGNK